MTPPITDWMNAVLGGAAIGTSAGLFHLFHGRIAGNSGQLKALILAPWKQAADIYAGATYVGGLLAAGLLLGSRSGAAVAAPPAITDATAVVAGLLVGAGTSMGNGCTSGHGLCGISRYSMRSLLATCTFLASAFFTTVATSGGFPTALGKFGHDAALLGWGLTAIPTAAALAGLTGYVGCKAGSPLLRHASDLLLAVLFGLGLGVGGMTDPAVVAGAFGAGGVFVPQLFVLFGTALVCTFVLYRASDALEAPCFHGKFPGKPSTTVDAPLLVGAVLFGAGWGLAGLCPGPWVVNVAWGPDLSLLLFGLGLAAGILGHQGPGLVAEARKKKMNEALAERDRNISERQSIGPTNSSSPLTLTPAPTPATHLLIGTESII